MMENIEFFNQTRLLSIRNILEGNLKFVIPDYQRGYRWTETHVWDLLNDILEFHVRARGDDEIYVLQPIVVDWKNLDNEEGGPPQNCFTVIDGQQRLTTIFLILNYLKLKESSEEGVLKETELYEIEYETREKSKDFLNKSLADIEAANKKTANPDDVNKSSAKPEATKDDNIDFYHMYKVKVAIKEWFEKDDMKNEMLEGQVFSLEEYLETFLDKVYFVWELIGKEDNHIDVFTRINGGKIPLTDSELIKALFLDKSKYEGDTMSEAHKVELATYWETIENTLQNDEFWLFICNESYFNKEKAGSPRIDYLFDIIARSNALGLPVKGGKEKAEEGNSSRDEHSTFRYFEKKFKDIKNWEQLSACWKELKAVFQILMEWYHDYKLFHYIGYLIWINGNNGIEVIGDLLKEYRIKDKIEFCDLVHKKISEVIAKKVFLFKVKEPESNTNPQEDKEGQQEGQDKNIKIVKEYNWEYQYEVEGIDKKSNEKGKSKTECVDILLLHNVETIVRKNTKLIKDEKYCLPNFTRFELHLYKKNSWEVEHIRPNAGDNFENNKDKELFIKSALPFMKNYERYKNKELKDEAEKYKELDEYVKGLSEGRKNGKEDTDFERLLDFIYKELGDVSSQLGDDDKDQIWNYTLLDGTDNKEYGNKIFPVKRRFLFYKDQGKKIKVGDLTKLMLGEITLKKLEEENKIQNVVSFIPPITKNVFAKTYTHYPCHMSFWTKEDAKSYLDNMKEVLADFIREAEEKVNEK